MSENRLFHSILLLEDDAGHALLIKRALKGFASEIVHCERLSLALQSLETDSFDLIIADLRLPDTSGAEHVEKLRLVSHDTPIVVLTSSTSIDDAVEAMKLGAQDFIVKSFDLDFQNVLGLSLSRIYSSMELEADKRQLQAEKSILQAAIENSQDGLGVIDRSAAPRYSNKAFKRFIALCEGQENDFLSICGARVEKGESLRAGIQKSLNELVEDAVWNTEVTFVHDEARAFDLSLSAIPADTEQDSLLGKRYVVWLRDISEQKRRESFQRKMLSTTKHDLKGPLGAIITGTELLAEMLEDSPKPRELVLRVSSAAHGAVNLIDEFLSAHLIQEGSFILKPSMHSLAELVVQARENYATIASTRRISLEFDIPDEPIEVCVDKLAFDRVLGNLISNSLKFTPSGGEVNVSLGVDKELHLQVSDTGSGMEAAEIQKVFERFARLEKHKDIDGSGLGLFVVRSVVQAHGGDIQVTSRVGQGTRFDISLPLKPPVNEKGELVSLDFA